MFDVRDIQPTDLPQVYEFTLKLLRYHIGQSGESALSQEDLARHFHNGFLKGLLLVKTPVEQNSNHQRTLVDQPIAAGFMIYHSDISLLRGGRGICLDQFYIEPEYRGLGLGRMMMTVLCKRVLASGANYIKLVYQDGLGLETIYGNMGFVNHSKGDVGIHLFEAYGKRQLDEFLRNAEHAAKVTSDTGGSSPKTQVLIVPFTMSHSEQETAILPVWSSVSSTDMEYNETGTTTLPSARLVIVSESGSCSSLSSALPVTGLLSRQHSRLCMFIEQSCICCWLGPMVNFADFVGDIGILDPDIFLKRIGCWIKSSPQVSGAVWEVPTEPCKPADVNENPGTLPALATKLCNLNVADDTASEGWNIAYLDLAGMRRLVGGSAVRNHIQN